MTQIVVDGRSVTAAPGVTVAAALMNANINTFRTSVVGEPRTPLCGMGVCHECRVMIDGVAHRRSCMVEVVDGMVVETKAGPSLRSGRQQDVAASWHEADVAVIGAGPAGIAAATVAAERGARVMLIDESARAGGQIWRDGAGASPPVVARQWVERLNRSGATIVSNATVSSVRKNGAIIVISAEREGGAVEVRARAVVLATGARERFVPFPGSTLPNVLGVGAVQALLKNGLNVSGKRVVIAGSGPLLMPVAASLVAHGAKLELVAEQAPLKCVARFALGLWQHPSAIVQAAQYRMGFLGTRYATGMWVSEARGSTSVEQVDVTDGVNTNTISCDLLCVAHGLVPNTELARQMGCEVRDGSVQVDAHLASSVDGVFCAGELTGIGGVDLAVAEGTIAGLAAVGARDIPARHGRLVRRLRRVADGMERAFALRPELRAIATPESIVCRCEDIAMREIDPGWTMRKAKLYSRAGMGACQGRTCGAALEFLLNAGADSVRLPTQPVLLSTLAAVAHAPAVHDHGERSDG